MKKRRKKGFLFGGISFPANYYGLSGRTTFHGSNPKSETIYSDR